MKNPGVVMRRTEDGLAAASNEAMAALAKVPVGDLLLVRLHRSRSLRQHKMFWAVLSHVAAATEWETPERLLIALKAALGRYDMCRLPNGRIERVMHSISFSEMDQGEFQRFMDEAMIVICRDVLPGMSVDELLREAASEQAAA